MTAKDLKNALLQEAVMGKLVPQDSSEGNARDLLEEIKKNHTDLQISTKSAGTKSDLRSKSQIRVTKKELPPVTAEEIPFDIPENWCWCRLGDVCNDIADIDHKMPPVCEKGIPYISPLNFTNDNKIDFDSAKKISKDDFIKLSKKCKPERDDIIFPRYGTIGVLRVVETDIDFLVSYSCATIKPHLTQVDSKYIYYVLLSPLIQITEIQRYINKTTQPNVGLQSIKQFLFPLPPLAEQKRIVAAIEKFMPLIEEYGKKESELNFLNAKIGALTKKAILQEAVQGRLVPQIAAEGSAKDLLDKIKTESSLRSKSQIRVTKKELPPVTAEEIPFDIPENWCWIRPTDIGYFLSGQTPKASDVDSKGDIPYFKVSDMNSEGNELYMNTVKNYLKPNSKYRLVPAKSIIYPKNGGAVFTNKKRILQKDSLVDLNTGAFVPFDGIDLDFFFLLFSTVDFNHYYKGTALPTVDTDAVKNIVWGLPPLAEQKRIVEAIEQLLPLCKKLGQ